MYEIGQWLFLDSLHCECQIIEISSYWDKTQYEVYIPKLKTTQIVSEEDLLSIAGAQNIAVEANRLAYICAAVKINQMFSDFKEKKAIVAPSRAEVIPLPHQIETLKKVMAKNPVRFLLADEVGLGKTIEAGLVIEEMKLRYHIKRILVVVPKGLALQWVAEMKKHFAEDFKLINGNDIEPLDRLFVSEGGAWKQFNQVVITYDSVKPLSQRRGWSKSRIDEYNNQRFENLLKAGWDLIIIDEAHRLGGSTDQVARYKLGKSLSENAPNLLLLSATPHQGKSDAFFRLMNILDERAFPTESSISRTSVAPFLVRTEKRKAINAEGERLFKDRVTTTVPVIWSKEHTDHKLLYEQVSEYARTGYNKAKKAKKPQVSFLMILLQRLVSSSTAAIRNTLEGRLEVLKELKKNEAKQYTLPSIDDFEEMTGEEQQEFLIDSDAGILTEVSEVESLLSLSRRCENMIDDPKTIAFVNLVSSLMEEEKDYRLKVLVFTEFVATQQMLAEKLERRNFKVEKINGSMSSDERKDAMRRFEVESNFLISTDAGGEGLNMQFSHIVINYDLPWNPMKIEQRIGRVDRIGQIKTVKVYNMLLASSVEYRVREVIEEKLRVVAEELGIDKTNDVLESSDNGNTVEKVLTEAIMNPKSADKFVNQAVSDIKAEAKAEKRMADLLDASSIEPNKESIRDVMDNPLGLITEKMVSQYVLALGGCAKCEKGKWNFQTSEGKIYRDIVFDSDLKGNYKSTKDLEVAKLLQNIPVFHKGARIPKVLIPNFIDGLSGAWGLFSLEITNGLTKKEFLQLDSESLYYFPVFLSSSGKVFKPTALRIWDKILKEPIEVSNYLSELESGNIQKQIESAAVQIAKEHLADYQIKQETLVEQERQRLINYDIYQENQIARTGLENIKKFRQAKLSLYNATIENEVKAYMDNKPRLQCYAVLVLEDTV